MSSKLSTIFSSLQAQQLPALITILEKAKQFALDSDIHDSTLLEQRLVEDMHPLRWQIQAVLELTWRALARLTEQEIPNLELNESSFDEVIEHVHKVIETISSYDLAKVDANAEKLFELPLGPDATLSLTGEDYVLKFFLPNFYFHLTTAYALLRAAGTPIGKLDFMGPVKV